MPAVASAQAPGESVTVASTAPVAGSPATIANGTAGSGSRTVASSRAPEVVGSTGGRWLNEDRKILVVVLGLVFVAVALTVLTIRYWRQTRPSRAVVTTAPPRHAADPARAKLPDDSRALATLRASEGKGAPAPDPTPGADPVIAAAAAAVTAAGGGSSDRTASGETSSDETSSAPAATPEPASAPDAEPDAAPAPATVAAARAGSGSPEPPEGTDRRSRRAVAGADHRAADADWEPRGTGEHERVEVTTTARGRRPSRDARRAALGRTPEAD
jgi:hypothetical protein